MSEVRVNFLNWRPDQEDVITEGLTVADNCIHDVEGYKPAHLMSAGAFATTGGLAATSATIMSIIAKPVGAQGDVFCGWLDAVNGTLHVGINGVTSGAATTGYPTAVSMATSISSGEITAFDVCESNGKIFFVIEGAAQTAVPNTLTALRMSGYVTY